MGETRGPAARQGRKVTLDLILIGLVITLEPIPLTAFVLILASERGTRKGAGFILGWLASLAAMIAITLAATGNEPPKPNTGPANAALLVKLLLGAALVVIALRRRRSLGKPKKPPKWQTGIDKMSWWYALALGVLTQPWGLVAAGAATIMEAKLSSWESSLALILFCLVATAAYLVAEVYVGFWPAQGQAMLGRLRTWLDTHTDQLIIIVSLVLGLWLIAKSIYTFVS